MTDTKINEKTSIPLPWAAAILVFLCGLIVTVVLAWARIESAVTTIEKTMAEDAKAHEQDRERTVAAIRENKTEMVTAVNEVRDELRKLVNDAVSQRQSLSWLELWQLTINAWLADIRAKNPGFQVSDLKVPPLPR